MQYKDLHISLEKNTDIARCIFCLMLILKKKFPVSQSYFAMLSINLSSIKWTIKTIESNFGHLKFMSTFVLCVGLTSLARMIHQVIM